MSLGNTFPEGGGVRGTVVGNAVKKSQPRSSMDGWWLRLDGAAQLSHLMMRMSMLLLNQLHLVFDTELQLLQPDFF